MRIFHIGVFDRNIGDSIALKNLQKSFTKYVPNVSFEEYNIENFWKNKNNVGKTISLLRDISSRVDAVLVGGGGLLEYGGYGTNETNYKLPFNKEVLNSIELPVYFYGLGVNIFRGGVDYSSEAVNAVQETIDNSKVFSVRNDGSLSKLKNWIKVDVTQVEEVPDPGLLHLDSFGIENKKTVKIGAIQPAFNHSQGINKHRFGTKDNLEFLTSFFKDYMYIPHTKKDFGQLGSKGIISKSEFNNEYRLSRNVYSYLENYKKADYVVAMRGHGQMITIGLNIPGIYLSTQDKVTDFSLQNGFDNYNVDILEDNWRQKLAEKVSLLTEPDSKYLKDWYEIRQDFIDKCHIIDKEFFKKYF